MSESPDTQAEAVPPRLLTVPDEESMYGLLAALNYGGSPELPCSAPGGVSFLATLTEPDADYVNYIWANESGQSRCVVGCENCGTEDSAKEDWKPRYPVTVILSQMPDLDRAAEDEIEEANWLRPTPSAEPDGEAHSANPDVPVYVSPDFAESLNVRAVESPAQDGAEVETLAEVLRTASWPVRFPGETRDKDVATRLARDLLASDWLAQRDKDRDAAVAAKVAEQIAQAIDGENSEWQGTSATTVGVKGALDHAAKLARAAAQAGGERE